jgi:fibronectin type 3 domain-containing protein
MQTSTSTVPYALSLTITGTSGTISHTASTTLLVNMAPPAGLTATAGDAKVTLSWSASAGASGYHVKRATIDGGPYETFACPSGTSVVDSGLINGTTYYYTVSAASTGGPDAGGESANSVQASATPQGVTAPPAPPTGLNTRSNKPGTIDLQWVQSPTPGVTSNGVYRRLMNGGTYPTSPTYTINANTSFRDNQPSRGVSYCYEVTAINANGESGPSNESCTQTR